MTLNLAYQGVFLGQKPQIFVLLKLGQLQIVLESYYYDWGAESLQKLILVQKVEVFITVKDDLHEVLKLLLVDNYPMRL